MSSTSRRKSAGNVAASGVTRPWLRRLKLAVLVALVVTMTWGTHQVWNQVRDEVAHRDEYRLTEDRIVVPPQPAWIRADVKREALRDGSLQNQVSVLDDDLLERVAQAFALHPWVEQVHQVRRDFPARLTLELTYRRPVAMVEVPGGLLPVDRHAVVLPSEDFSSLEAGKYPRLAGIPNSPLGPVGTAWGEPTVAAAARIAAALAEAWDELGLRNIRPASSAADAASPAFVLVAASGTVVPWGPAPADNPQDQAAAAEKVARLRAWLRERGSLEGAAVDQVAPDEPPAAVSRKVAGERTFE